MPKTKKKSQDKKRKEMAERMRRVRQDKKQAVFTMSSVESDSSCQKKGQTNQGCCSYRPRLQTAPLPEIGGQEWFDPALKGLTCNEKHMEKQIYEKHYEKHDKVYNSENELDNEMCCSYRPRLQDAQMTKKGGQHGLKDMYKKIEKDKVYKNEEKHVKLIKDKMYENDEKHEKLIKDKMYKKVEKHEQTVTEVIIDDNHYQCNKEVSNGKHEIDRNMNLKGKVYNTDVNSESIYNGDKDYEEQGNDKTCNSNDKNEYYDVFNIEINEKQRNYLHEKIGSFENLNLPCTVDIDQTNVLDRPGMIVVQGSFHQGHQIFKENRGKQCVANSLTAFVYSNLKNVNTWQKADIDNILITGNELYTFLQRCSSVEHEYLLIRELPQQLDIYDQSLSFEYHEPIASVIRLNDVQLNLSEWNAFNLDEALQMALFESDACFVCFGGNAMLVGKNSNHYFIFDSHSRCQKGLLNPFGKSVLILSKSIDDIYRHFVNLAHSMNLTDVTQCEVTSVSIAQNNMAIPCKSIPDELMTHEGSAGLQSTQNKDFCKSQIEMHCNHDKIEICQEVVHNEVENSRRRQHSEQTVTKNDTSKDLAIIGTTQPTLLKFKQLPMLTKQKLCSEIGHLITCSQGDIYIDNEHLGTPLTTQCIKGDGNCFFRAISFALTDTEENHAKIRCAVVNHMLKNERKFRSHLRAGYKSVYEYVSKKHMLKIGTWATEIEILAVADYLSTDVYICMDNMAWCQYSTKQIDRNNIAKEGGIYLKHCFRSHYDVVLSVKDKEDSIMSYADVDRFCKNDIKSSVKKQNDQTNIVIEQNKNIKGNICKSEKVEKNMCASKKGNRRKQLEIKKKRVQEKRVTSDTLHTVQAKKSDKEKVKYNRDIAYRTKKITDIKTKYRTDELYRNKLRSANKRLYQDNDEYRTKKQKISKEKYLLDNDFRNKLKTSSIEKYQKDQKHREKLKSCSIKKYAKDKEHQKNVKRLSSNKYATDESHRQNVKKSSINKYALDEDHRNRVKETFKRKFKEDPNYRFKIKQSKNRRQEYNKQKNREIDNVIQMFKKEVSKGPEFVCSCCHRLLFENQVLICDKDMYSRISVDSREVSLSCISEKYLHKCNDDCEIQCKYLNSSRIKLWICYTCHRKIMQGKMPAEAAANNLEVEDIPLELKCLNNLEQHLVSLHIPFMKILNLPKGGQKGVHGPVVCVPSDVKKAVASLPRAECDDILLRVKLIRKLSYKGYEDYQFVCTKHLEDALEYLKRHNDWYFDIEIDKKWSNPLPDISDKVKILSNENTESSNTNTSKDESSLDDNYIEDKDSCGVQFDTCLQPADIGQDVLDYLFDTIFNLAPAEGNDPVSILSEKGNEAKSFPVLFPSGKHTKDDDREYKLSMSRYFNIRLRSADNRFAKDTTYIFFSQYLSELQQVISNVQISLRKSSSKSHDGGNITRAMLQDKEILKHLFKKDEALKFLKPVRGTPPYWQATQKDIFAMIRQLGIPTWFCSFSCANFRWNEIIDTILKQQGDCRKAADLDWNDKCNLLKSNPVTDTVMFDHRFHSFLQHVILSEANPIGKVIDYFYRIEFQQRGTPHTHCLFWIKDAPKFNENNDDEIIAFIDQYVTNELPLKESDPDLYEIVSSVQQHSKTHSKSCRKKGTVCRFNFPRPISNKTFVSRVEDSEEEHESETISNDVAKDRLQSVWDVLLKDNIEGLSTTDIFEKVAITQEMFEEAFNKITRKNSVVMKRRPNEIWINQYNPHLLRCWNANMDIQYIMDAFSCVVYIISYISKSEREMGMLLQETKNEAEDGNLSAQETMRKVGSVYLHNREISVQEAVYRVCNLRLKECSRKVVFVPVGENPTRLTIPLKKIQMGHRDCSTSDNIDETTIHDHGVHEQVDPKCGDDEDIWMKSIVDRYLNRPHKQAFTHMCLAEFSSKFRVLSKSQVPKRINPETTYMLLNSNDYIQERTRTEQAVIRYPRFCPEKSAEKYYQSILQLFLPYRIESQLKPRKYTTFESFYFSGSVKYSDSSILLKVRDIVDSNYSAYNQSTTVIDQIEKIFENIGPQEDAWALLCPENELERDECFDIGAKCSSKADDGVPEKDIPDLHKGSREKTTTINTSTLTQSEVQPLLRSLNKQQSDVFYHVRNWCLDKIQGKYPKPFHLFVTGGAGTGKSHLIKCIFFETTRLLRCIIPNPDDITVMLTAPTGTAAFNINGATIHSAFSIFKQLKIPYEGLKEDKINTLRSKLENLHILIIDEISMVHKKLLYYIHERLRQIKKTPISYPFGNVSILAVGDFYQLPPVLQPRKEKLFVQSPENPVDYWNSLFSLVELNEIMRQKEDKEFAECLNRLRIKTKTDTLNEKDLEMLQSCETKGPDDALHIFSTNAEVMEYNQEMIQKVCTDVKVIESQDYQKDKTTGKLVELKKPLTEKCSSLPGSLMLAVGARIMLTRNIETRDGLVNGVMGTVTKLEFAGNNSLPHSIYVTFDNEKVGKNSKMYLSKEQKHCVPIKPVEDEILEKNSVRKQFPLQLAWACTAHKVQGLTVDQAVVNLNKCFAPGQAYVALSRVTSKKGLFIEKLDNKKIHQQIFCDRDIVVGMSEMFQFLTKMTLSVSSNNSFTLVLHNIQGLEAHFIDMKSNHYLKSSDYICLTETWMKSKEERNSVQMEGYSFHHFTRSNLYDESNDMFSELKTSCNGGVGFYASSSSCFTHIPNPVQNLEVIVFKDLKMNIIVATIYRPKTYKLQIFRNKLQQLINHLDTISQHSIIMGDFNEDISQGNCTVEKLMQSNNFHQHVVQPTTESGSVIDHVYIKGIPNVKVSVIGTYYSYHEALVIEIQNDHNNAYHQDFNRHL